MQLRYIHTDIHRNDKANYKVLIDRSITPIHRSRIKRMLGHALFHAERIEHIKPRSTRFGDSRHKSSAQMQCAHTRRRHRAVSTCNRSERQWRV